MSDDEEKEREQNLRKLWCYVKDMYQKLPKLDQQAEHERRRLMNFLNVKPQGIELESLYENFRQHWEQRLKKDD